MTRRTSSFVPRQTSIGSLVPALATVEDPPYNGKIYNTPFFQPSIIVILCCRQWNVSENQFVLTGIVAGNPSGCEKRSLPDVYNFVGNQDVSMQLRIFVAQS